MGRKRPPPHEWGGPPMRYYPHTDAALAAGFTPAATCPYGLPNAVGGRLLDNPNRIPEGEQARRRSRPADERKPSGFPLICLSLGRPTGPGRSASTARRRPARWLADRTATGWRKASPTTCWAGTGTAPRRR